MKMKRNKVLKNNKISADLEHRLTKLEDATKSLSDDVKNLNTEVTEKFTGISTAIDQTNQDLKALLDRKREHEAVKGFLSNTLKLSAAIFGFVSSIATFLWAVTQVINFYRGR